MRIIGVCGLMGAGKTYFSKLLSETYNLEYVSSDLIFKEEVITNEYYKQLLVTFFEQYNIDAFDGNGKYNTEDISELLFNETQLKQEFHILSEFNDMNRCFIIHALMNKIMNSQKDVILEMALLLENPIKELCDYIYKIVPSEIDHVEYLNSLTTRNPNRKVEHIKGILNYQIKSFQINFIYSQQREMFINSLSIRNGVMIRKTNEELIKLAEFERIV